VKKFLDDQLKKLGTVRASEAGRDEAGNATHTNLYWTNGTLFPQTGGPWREAFNRLTDPATVGMSPDQAAQFSTHWFKDSITHSTPQKIRTMLEGRGVTPTMQRAIITQAFGKKGWDIAVGHSAASASANDPTRQSGTYMPNGTAGNTQKFAAAQVKELKGKTVKPLGTPDRWWKLSGYNTSHDGSLQWIWKSYNGKTQYIDATPGQGAVNALVNAIKRNPRITQ
jgi:hypothetical protein